MRLLRLRMALDLLPFPWLMLVSDSLKLSSRDLLVRRTSSNHPSSISQVFQVARQLPRRLAVISSPFPSNSVPLVLRRQSTHYKSSLPILNSPYVQSSQPRSEQDNNHSISRLNRMHGSNDFAFSLMSLF